MISYLIVKALDKNNNKTDGKKTKAEEREKCLGLKKFGTSERER